MDAFGDAVARSDAADADAADAAARAAAEIGTAIAEFLDAMGQMGNLGLHSVPLVEMRDVRRQVSEGSRWNRRQREVVDRKPCSTGSLSGWSLAQAPGPSYPRNADLAVLTDGRLLRVTKPHETGYGSYSWMDIPSLSPEVLRVSLADGTAWGLSHAHEIPARLVETYRVCRALHPPR